MYRFADFFISVWCVEKERRGKEEKPCKQLTKEKKVENKQRHPIPSHPSSISFVSFALILTSILVLCVVHLHSSPPSSSFFFQIIKKQKIFAISYFHLMISSFFFFACYIIHFVFRASLPLPSSSSSLSEPSCFCAGYPYLHLVFMSGFFAPR